MMTDGERLEFLYALDRSGAHTTGWEANFLESMMGKLDRLEKAGQAFKVATGYQKYKVSVPDDLELFTVNQRARIDEMMQCYATRVEW